MAKTVTDATTEEKIKSAAKNVFHKKGFAATRTRDIAEEAEVNLALLNYYFRSKENLFSIIMLESLQGFIFSLQNILTNESTTLDNKIETLVNKYIDLLIQNPDIPLFILSELRARPDEFVSKVGIKQLFLKSHLIKQYTEGVQTGKYVSVHPLHFIINLLGMTVFPFIARPMIKGVGNINQESFNALMVDRKTLIPKWIKTILKAK